MIRFHDVCYSYIEHTLILDRITLEIGPGLTLLLGPNGCGKSTLLKTIAGVERPDSGYIEIDGHNLWRDEAEARRDLAFVPEQPDLTPYASIRDVIALVCRLRHVPASAGKDVLEKVSLDRVSNRTIRELSMGQRRRVVLAAAWIGTPNIVLLDEPFESMDRNIREHIHSWIDSLIEKNAVLVVVTHEIEPFVMKVEQVVTIQDGRCSVHATLPSNPQKRLEYLDKFGRGM
jgi:ABC-type multidrug transport system ATPase subunit